MKVVAIVEFWLLVCFVFAVIIIWKFSSSEHKENQKLKSELIKAKSDAEYTKKLMELKEESYRNAKEQNKKLETGTKSDRINAAGNILCDN